MCFGAQYLVFVAVESAGLKVGSGSYAAMYCALVCGISSTMIVVKLLSEKGETDRPNGRLTVGILIFQDIWAMVFLAIQPNLASPDLVTWLIYVDFLVELRSSFSRRVETCGDRSSCASSSA